MSTYVIMSIKQQASTYTFSVQQASHIAPLLSRHAHIGYFCCLPACPTWLLMVSGALAMHAGCTQYFAGGQGSPHRPGHWWPQLSTLAHRMSQGSLRPLAQHQVRASDAGDHCG